MIRSIAAIRSHPRRGVALLVVLGVLVVTVAALTTTARLATTVGLQRRAAAHGSSARDLLLQTERPIQVWLSAASQVVLPPEATLPEVEVLHHQWQAGETDIALRITAYDQCGMMDLRAPRGSPLRQALPPEINRELVHVTLPRGAAAGLDMLLSPPGAVERRRVFPEAPPGVALRFGHGLAASGAGRADAPQADANEDDGMEDAPAIGAFVATHNSRQSINVNTAPVHLLEAAYRTDRRGGLDVVLTARADGRATMPGRAGPGGDRSRRTRGGLTGVSDAWSFRIDIHVGLARQSWWCVYRKDSDRQPWRCVQRLAIPE